MPAALFIACSECDLLHREAPSAVAGIARCQRCQAVLFRRGHAGLDRTLALTLGAALLFLIANLLPLASLDMQGQEQQATLFGAIQALYEQDMAAVAILVFMTTMVAPAIELVVMLYLLVPLRFGWPHRDFPRAFRLLEAVRPWVLVDVFILGALVSLIKLGDIATVVSGIALWSMGGLILLLAAIANSFNFRELWLQVRLSK
jgi:paraquat-inducible protein A